MSLNVRGIYPSSIHVITPLGTQLVSIQPSRQVQTMTNSAAFKTHSGFSDILDKYDGFILDQFGVMREYHEGL